MNLLRGLPNRRTVLSWGSFDLANQSFTLIINTLLFGIFVKEVVMSGHESGKFVWGLMGSISLGVVALTGPVLGAFADARACKKKILVGTGYLCALFTMGLAFLPSASSVGLPTALVLAFLLYLPANIAYNIGENILASFLPEISTRKTMGQVSALGWAMGYLGSLLLLIALVIAAFGFGLKDPPQFRPMLFFAGLWFSLVILPTVLFLPEHKIKTPAERGDQQVRDAFRQIGTTIREASRFRDLATLLMSFFIYGMGVQVVIFFAGLIAEDSFGFTMPQLFVFSIIVTLSGGAAAILTGTVQDHIGHKATLLAVLAIWTTVALSLLLISWLRLKHGAAFPIWPVWIVGAGVGIGLGGVGTATRASVGVLTPAHRTAEFFGLWGMTYKMAGVVGLPIFGWVWYRLGSITSLAVLTAFFVCGGLLLWRRLNMDRGTTTAHDVEEEFARQH